MSKLKVPLLENSQHRSLGGSLLPSLCWILVGVMVAELACSGRRLAWSVISTKYWCTVPRYVHYFQGALGLSSEPEIRALSAANFPEGGATSEYQHQHQPLHPLQNINNPKNNNIYRKCKKSNPSPSSTSSKQIPSS